MGGLSVKHGRTPHPRPLPTAGGGRGARGRGARAACNRFFSIIETTLDNICEGGIYDHLGGGFSRYSVDERWLVPHFEKMLYDNAQLLELLALAWTAHAAKSFIAPARPRPSAGSPAR